MQKLHTNTSASTGSGADGSTGPGLSRSTDSGIRDQNDVETPIDSSTGHYHCIALINVSLGGLNYTMGELSITLTLDGTSGKIDLRPHLILFRKIQAEKLYGLRKRRQLNFEG